MIQPLYLRKAMEKAILNGLGDCQSGMTSDLNYSTTDIGGMNLLWSIGDKS